MAFYDVIRCDNVNGGIDWLMYKHPVDEFNNKSRLIVSPGQVAIIVHNGKIEKICQEGTYKINSELLPFLKNFTKAFFGGNNPYPIEIYFINKRLKLDLLWGTSDPVKLIDPKYNIQINVRARGQLGVRLDNYQYFYQTLVGSLMKGNYIDFKIIQTFFRGKIVVWLTPRVGTVGGERQAMLTILLGAVLLAAYFLLGEWAGLFNAVPEGWRPLALVKLMLSGAGRLRRSEGSEK
jgi:membrane protease subunit (stomatin/prohibitin family)